MKFTDFQQVTRSRTLPRLVLGADEMLEVAQTIARRPVSDREGYPLAGCDAVIIGRYGQRRGRRSARTVLMRFRPSWSTTELLCAYGP
ncbi:hypothetical protein [Mesorhizobium sp. B2-3-15]|uniref:hypothetical protein n=1 Tax=Mesorhizobium sp. B2-3-15 TaxID=2589949 RepID=UPI001FEE9C82|nr:hypothetical protein [Mesorhizobium sp. B2-3-15]